VQEPWIGALIPKRWAKRAVTRNAIKRQIYTVSQQFEPPCPSPPMWCGCVRPSTAAVHERHLPMR
jgi:RNase P protein component